MRITLRAVLTSGEKGSTKPFTKSRSIWKDDLLACTSSYSHPCHLLSVCHILDFSSEHNPEKLQGSPNQAAEICCRVTGGTQYPVLLKVVPRVTMACFKAGQPSSSLSLPALSPRTTAGSPSSSSACLATSSSTSPSSSTAGSCTSWRQNIYCLSACRICLEETLSSPLAFTPSLWTKLNQKPGRGGCPSFRCLLFAPFHPGLYVPLSYFSSGFHVCGDDIWVCIGKTDSEELWLERTLPLLHGHNPHQPSLCHLCPQRGRQRNQGGGTSREEEERENKGRIICRAG